MKPPEWLRFITGTGNSNIYYELLPLSRVHNPMILNSLLAQDFFMDMDSLPLKCGGMNIISIASTLRCFPLAVHDRK